MSYAAELLHKRGLLDVATPEQREIVYSSLYISRMVPDGHVVEACMHEAVEAEKEASTLKCLPELGTLLMIQAAAEAMPTVAPASRWKQVHLMICQGHGEALVSNRAHAAAAACETVIRSHKDMDLDDWSVLPWQQIVARIETNVKVN